MSIPSRPVQKAEMPSEPTTSCATQDLDSNVSDAAVLFAKLKISHPASVPLKKWSFLDLPAELRIMVYRYFTPEDQSAASCGGYNGFLQTCKQIRNEAPKEIRSAAQLYYHAYEKEWLAKYGHVIKITIGTNLAEVSVEWPDPPQSVFGGPLTWLKPRDILRQRLPLASLPLRSLTILLLPSDSSPQAALLRKFYQYRLVGIALPTPRIICFQCGSLLAEKFAFDARGNIIYPADKGKRGRETEDGGSNKIARMKVGIF